MAVIELAIYINMALAYFTGTTLPFIASICIGTIQLGATVDYAILMTTRYKKERMAGCSKEEAVKIALSTSIHSIMSSALGFFAATIGVGLDRLPVPAHGTRRHHQYVCCHLYHAQYVYAA